MISRLRASRLLRLGLVAIAIAGCAYGLASRWDETRHAVAQLSWPSIGAAFVVGVAGLGAWMLAWRALLAGLGSPLPLRVAVRIYVVSQLGKYIPGSVWTLVAQMELAREHHVPRARGGGAALLAMGTTIACGCAVAAVTLPLTSSDATHRYWWLLALAPMFLAMLHPRVVSFGLNLALRVLRRPLLEQQADLGTMAIALAWTLLGWALFGLHAWLLARAAGGSGFLLAAGAYALAFTAGFLVVIAPGGVGVREAALAVALGPVLPAGAPLVVALASRVVMTVADLVWAGVAVFLLGKSGGKPGGKPGGNEETPAGLITDTPLPRRKRDGSDHRDRRDVR